MPRRSKQDLFRVIGTTLALAEERGVISMSEAARLCEVTPDELREILDPVLFLEFRTSRGDLVNEARAFLLTEQHDLVVTEDHWLRNLASAPPEFETALRLLVAGTALKSFVTLPTPDLDRALRKLDDVVRATFVVTVESPPMRSAVEKAYRAGRTFRCRYVNDRGESRTREIEPWYVYSNWGRWYVFGRDVTEESPKTFRVDRIIDVELGDRTFEPPEDFVIPEWFDLSEHERTVRLRLPAAELDNLPTPNRVEDIVTLDDGRVEARVTVFGEQRLAHLLVVLPPEAEVLEPAEDRELRRTHAAKLLAMYDGGA